jgi:probable rRNA maturation factor
MKVKALQRLSVKASHPHTASTLQQFNASTIKITSRQRTRKINLCRLRQIAEALFADLGVESAELGVYLVAEPEMIHLNETHLQHAGSTDVITFDYSDRGGQCFVTAPRSKATTRRCPALHGEIFICVDEAVRQARRFGTSWQSEIVRYLVHGVLHLRGLDDSSAGFRRKMKREEDRQLRSLSRRFSLARLGRPVKLLACKNRLWRAGARVF